MVDGALRDVVEWYSDEILVWARGHTPRGPSKDGAGEVNVPVACAGMAAAPGDLVIADADGVVAVPADEAPGLLVRARAHLANEARTRTRNADGTIDEARFDAVLRAMGCPVVSQENVAEFARLIQEAGHKISTLLGSQASATLSQDEDLKAGDVTPIKRRRAAKA
ncbi:hypothetical protein [Bradyrhizobium yuanmingense]|uniref:RraA family protein n=1 Tax=Bradyrhizobium yuanmingense TaxID=108015 RepID=UPI001FCE77F2|nr:hypothetical protein [Bradyrhizobium yuanmingense]